VSWAAGPSEGQTARPARCGQRAGRPALGRDCLSEATANGEQRGSDMRAAKRDPAGYRPPVRGRPSRHRREYPSFVEPSGRAPRL